MTEINYLNKSNQLSEFSIALNAVKEVLKSPITLPPKEILELMRSACSQVLKSENKFSFLSLNEGVSIKTEESLVLDSVKKILENPFNFKAEEVLKLVKSACDQVLEPESCVSLQDVKGPTTDKLVIGLIPTNTLKKTEKNPVIKLQQRG